MKMRWFNLVRVPILLAHLMSDEERNALWLVTRGPASDNSCLSQGSIGLHYLPYIPISWSFLIHLTPTRA